MWVQLPAGTSMIATDVATPFITPIKLTLVVSFFVAIPYLLYQAWAFIAPGLYQHERRLILPLVASSAVLFYAGMAFAYYVVFPLVFGFFTSTAPAGVTVATDIASYLDFVLTTFPGCTMMPVGIPINRGSVTAAQIAEVTVRTKGPVLRVKESSEDMYAAIDLMVDKLDRQVLKYKTKAADHGHDSLKNHVAES